MEAHLQHLQTVLHTLSQHKFFVKLSKCEFCQTSVVYLGHIVLAQGLQVDGQKIEAILKWPIPQNVKQLRGFLGLTGYYRKFVKGYAGLAWPLTELLKLNSFTWTPAAEKAFRNLQTALTTTPILALPDFSQTFVMETDASNSGVGAVLSQNDHPLAYFSKKLTKKNVTSISLCLRTICYNSGCC